MLRMRWILSALVLAAWIAGPARAQSGGPPLNEQGWTNLAPSADSRVVYVDNDQVAVAHSQLLLHGNEHATVVKADLRRPDQVLTNPDTVRRVRAALGVSIGSPTQRTT